MSSYVATSEPMPKQTGFLTLNSSGAILASGGDLENDERKADVIYKLVCQQQKLDSFIREGCTRLSIIYSDFSYVICISNKKIYAVKKRNSDEIDAFVPDMNIPISNSINA